MIGVYIIISPSGKAYIGSSANIFNRIKHYEGSSCAGQPRLHNSLKKYGWANHYFQVIEECSIEELYSKERFYGEMFNVLGVNGLNCILPKAGEEKAGIADETLQKMRDRKIGSNNPQFGIPRTEEQKRKTSNSLRGKIISASHNQKLKDSNNSNVFDEETGIFYDSIGEAAKAKNINYRTLLTRMSEKSQVYTPIKRCSVIRKKSNRP